MRDEYDVHREAAAARMASESGEQKYRRRMWMAETPFAVIKQVLGVRQFLLRGRENVQTEWLWTCCAFNLRKMVRHMAQLRKEQAEMAA